MARRRARWFSERRADARARFKVEADLCSAFVDKARGEGLVVHAETSGWDLLLVEPISGTQIGVQAKLRANCDVLAQAIGYPEARVGPDVHAVLVVDAPPSFRQVATRLRVLVFDHVDLDPVITVGKRLEAAQLWSHEERAWVPPVEIECVVGGRSGPVQLTPWKIAALELCRVLRRRGWASRTDFVRLKISPTYWLDGRRPLLRREKLGKVTRYYVAEGAPPLPDERWPDIALALETHFAESDERRRDDDDAPERRRVSGSDP